MHSAGADIGLLHGADIEHHGAIEADVITEHRSVTIVHMVNGMVVVLSVPQQNLLWTINKKPEGLCQK
jgi:hypothetical protein